MDILKSGWPWYVSGPLLTLILGLMLYMGKTFGVSSTLRDLCAIGGAGKTNPFFQYRWQDQIWNLVFVAGALIGGMIAATLLSDPEPIQLSSATISDLGSLGFSTDAQHLAPPEIFSWNALLSVKGVIFIVLGGFLVGFGTRYAAGCTSGHAITGLSNLQVSSLLAVVGFFLGGLFVTHLIFPYLAKI
ncbi:MAG: YeeE/YedE thiosulfate transporter family protein [Bacteroidia bacterium]|nr:YeeE/YedE thiosulfate transporter family protein [Bacteroidia bacterium]